MKTKHLGAFS